MNSSCHFKSLLFRTDIVQVVPCIWFLLLILFSKFTNHQIYKLLSE